VNCFVATGTLASTRMRRFMRSIGRLSNSMSELMDSQELEHTEPMQHILLHSNG
jgi:hypothetical protein